MKKRFASIIALALVVLLVIGLLAGFIIPYAHADDSSSVSSMQNQLDNLEKRKAQLEQELNVISEQKEKEFEKKSIIDEQINDTLSEIEILNQMVAELDNQLEENQKQLTEAQQKLEESMQLSKDRIRASYEQGYASYWEIILSSESLYDFISKVEIVRQIAEYDNKIINELTESKKTIEQAKAKIEQQKEEQESAISSLSEKEEALKKKQEASDELIEKYNNDSAAAERALEKAEAAEAELQAEIRRLLQTSTSKVVDAGDFRYPLDAKWNIITSQFGGRTHPITGVYKLHTGVDISGSGIRGSNIYAAKGGTVIKAGYNTGYGNYVLIDHGDGYATLYGHADSLCVKAGQTVTKGDVIAYVGSTGYSTGPHLHFEIIKNGEYQNPVDYFSGYINFIYS
jgi:hypothetical protein